MNHLDPEKTTWLCSRCSRPYFQVDREVFNENSKFWDNKARRVLYKEHKCPWQVKKSKGGAV